MSVFFAAVLSALITSAALLIQGHQQNKREDARLAADVERRAEDWRRELERRAEDRRDALDDYWRDARHLAHVSALSAMQSALEGLDDVARLSREEGVPVSRDAVREFGMELVRTVTEVRLICTDAAAEAADEAYLTMVALNLALFIEDHERRVGSEHRVEAASDNVSARYKNASAAIERYRLTVRHDLGTADLVEFSADSTS